jgi:RNA polymerase sigma-70 factor (ECF subfamily)
VKASDPTGLSQSKLEALYIRLEKPMYNVVYRRLWDSEASRDVVQEAFLRLWDMRARVRLATVEPLVYRIALNLAAKRRRTTHLWRWLSFDRERSDSVSEPVDKNPGLDSDLLKRERETTIRRSIEALPTHLRDVIFLTEFSEMNYDQIAESLGIPPGTVGSRRHAALKRLRDELDEFATGDR